MRAAAVIFVALACACGPRVLADDGGEETTSSATTDVSTTPGTTTGTTTGTSATTTGMTTTGTTSTTAEDSTGAPDTCSDTGCNFICDADFGGRPVECDIWEEDCPCGQKCMPWANDGGSSWNATKCVPIAPDPKQPGEPCTVEGSAVSGIDDCDFHSMCWNVDPETNMGTCIALCIGSESDPSCESPCDTCVLTSDGALIPCLPECDPLAQQPCADAEACIPVLESFVCGPDASGPDLGAAGDPCEYINACDPGLFCSNPDVVPGCEGGIGCCAPFCDLSAGDPCPDAAPGVECVPWYEPGMAPEGCFDAANVGACVLP